MCLVFAYLVVNCEKGLHILIWKHADYFHYAKVVSTIKKQKSDLLWNRHRIDRLLRYRLLLRLSVIVSLRWSLLLPLILISYVTPLLLWLLHAKRVSHLFIVRVLKLLLHIRKVAIKLIVILLNSFPHVNLILNAIPLLRIKIVRKVKISIKVVVNQS
jgi:hypothetical protein